MTEKCCECGKFCIPYDEETSFGCSSYDPPEPLDPDYYCKKCAKDLEKKWFDVFKGGDKFSGSWQKSNAEIKMAKKFSLVWIHSNGVGTLGSKNWAEPYQYISKKEYDRLNKLPYWGYCEKCGTVRKGGYCSDNNCEKSFNFKNKKEK